MTPPPFEPGARIVVATYGCECIHARRYDSRAAADYWCPEHSETLATVVELRQPDPTTLIQYRPGRMSAEEVDAA